MKPDPGSTAIGELQQRHQRDEFRTAVRALLMQPLMGPGHEAFPAVRRQTDKLCDWFQRETGWILHVEREGARLYKRPADLGDATRGLPDYGRRRYALLCLACAVLERADPQITLRVIGERLLDLAAEPALVARGFAFTLGSPAERRDLVTVCRTLLGLGVMQRVAGDEEGYVHGIASQADALYDVHRRTLAGMLAAIRGPSTWPPEDAPASLPERLRALVAEHMADSEEGRRTALRHHLARRLLDDPVVYADTLDAEAQGYFANQRGPMAARLCDATGLTAEQRAEGVALTDEAGTLTDVAMPSEGTDAHATLLVAEHLAGLARRDPAQAASSEDEIIAFLAEARERYGRYWRKSAREAGGARELAAIALDRLQRLQLAVRDGTLVRPRPALARFALGDADVRDRRSPPAQATLPF
jgi:uncharacterized protein (TIGR02678 family)